MKATGIVRRIDDSVIIGASSIARCSAGFVRLCRHAKGAPFNCGSDRNPQKTTATPGKVLDMAVVLIYLRIVCDPITPEGSFAENRATVRKAPPHGFGAAW